MKVVVVDYDAGWSLAFAKEAERIRQVFGDDLLQIHHIGSTAVPGLKAKPIIDIMPLVRRIEVVDQYTEAMQALGYEVLGEFGLPGRRYFRKGGKNRTHHVHVFAAASLEAERHLALRDYLRAHAAERESYGQLKAALAQRYPDDIEAYMDGKDGFVKALELKALDWFRRP